MSLKYERNVRFVQATPDMRNTMSDYYIENAAYDIDVKGTYGLTAEDLASLTDYARFLAAKRRS